MSKGKGAVALLIASAVLLLSLLLNFSVAQAEGDRLEKALQFAEERKDKYVQELVDLVKIPSVSTLPEHEEDVRKAANFISSRCEEAGLENVEIMETGAQPVVYADWMKAPGKPTVLVYAHYDVQPAEPFELWSEEPFDPKIKDGKLFGRGTSDDKQGVLLTIQAVESILKTGGSLPVNVKFILEGQEEIGSPQLETFLDKHGEKFAAEFCFSADGGQISEKMPRVITSLRGMAAVEVDIKTANSDLHSGTFGGAAPNAMHVLTDMVASLHDEDGRVTVPGFYDDVTLMTEEEKSKTEFPDALLQWALGNDGIKATPGEKGFGPFARTTVRPTLEIVGMWGGFQGEGIKTIVPKEAHAKIACRLVGNQNARKIQELLRKHLESICPDYAEISFKGGSFDVAQPYSVSFDAPTSVMTKAVLEKTFVGVPVLFSKMGGTIPAMNLFKEKLNAESALLGFTEADNQLHAPNEFMRLSMYHKGREAYIRLFFEVDEHHAGDDSKTEL